MKPSKSVIAGLVLGVVSGDCLGNPYLYMKSCKLFEMGKQVQWQIGLPGECSHLLTSSLESVAQSGVSMEKIARSYRAWAQTGHDVGYIISECFGGMKCTVSELRVKAQQAEYGSLCSNMLLLRQIPLVCAGLDWTDKKLCEMVQKTCFLTHSDELCIEYAQIYALCLRDILLGKSRLDIWDHLFASVRSREVYRVLLSSYYEKPLCDGADYSHIRVAFGMALYHFWHDTPASSAIRSAILSGGSTDINAGATGALCGAFQGMESIPDAWREILYNGFEQPHADLANRAIVSIERILGRKMQPAAHVMRESGVARRIGRPKTECVEYAQSA